MADLEVPAGASSPKSFPQKVSYGKNYLEKFRKHAEQIRRTTGKKEIGKVSSAEGEEQIKTLIEEIVMTGETRQQRYMRIPDALWSRTSMGRLKGQFQALLGQTIASLARVALSQDKDAPSSLRGGDQSAPPAVPPTLTSVLA